MFLLSPEQIAKARTFNQGRAPKDLTDWPAVDSEDFALHTAAFQHGAKLTVDGMFGPKTEAAYRASQGVTAAPLPVSGALPPIRKVAGLLDRRKPEIRNFAKQQYIQVHQMDFKLPSESKSVPGIKSNLIVTEDDQAIELHPVDAVIIKNYSDFYHIEVSWVSASRATVKDNGKTYKRTPSIWTPAKEEALEVCLVYGVEEFRARGYEPIIITHCQTYKNRVIDPDLEIAQATHRIAERRGFKLDYDWVRGSGRSAAKWYPAGKGKLT